MKKTALLVSLLFISYQFISAQELDATVTLNYEQLENSAKERLDNFKNQVQDYLNNNKFTRQTWQGDKIKCFFTIMFVSSPDETSYSAQLVVASQRPVDNPAKLKISSLMLNILDNSWQFKYQKNQAMYFNQTDFDPLTSLLDYYAYIIIGLDSDSFDKLGGTDYFQKALDICVRGGSNAYSKGWQTESSVYNRRGLVDNLLNAKYQQFRLDYFDYHYNGLDLIRIPEEQAKAVNNIIKLVKNLEAAKDKLDSRSVLLKVFFDAKAGEMSEIFKNMADKSIIATLKKIDPPHASKYDEALK